ncbi:MAG: tRNA dihydrouridine synthase DusB, partial [Hafnia alvei]
TFNAIEDASEQLEALEAYFENLSVKKELTELCSNNA